MTGGEENLSPGSATGCHSAPTRQIHFLEPRYRKQPDAANTGQNGAVTPDSQSAETQIQRQIIYEAQLDLLVEEF